MKLNAPNVNVQVAPEEVRSAAAELDAATLVQMKKLLEFYGSGLFSDDCAQGELIPLFVNWMHKLEQIQAVDGLTQQIDRLYSIIFRSPDARLHTIFGGGHAVSIPVAAGINAVSLHVATTGLHAVSLPAAELVPLGTIVQCEERGGWYDSKVVASKPGKVKVRVMGWPSQHDAWMVLDSDRLRLPESFDEALAAYQRSLDADPYNKAAKEGLCALLDSVRLVGLCEAR